MRSLSNVIKAYSIRYNDHNKHVIDMNAAAEEKVKYYLDMLQIEDEKVNRKPSSEGGFVEGLMAATVEESSIDDMTQEELNHVSEEFLNHQPSFEEVNEKAKAIIEEAKQEVSSMLEQAREDAVKVSHKIKEDAKQEGYQEGKELAKAELLKEQLAYEQRKRELEHAYEQKVKNFEPIFVDLLISYVKRFTGVILDDKKDIILYLLEQELLNIESSNTYLIHVSQEDFDIVNAKKSEISWKLKENADIEIVEDRMLSRAQCLIETDSRIIDCSLDVQLKNLVCDLKLLAGPREEENA